MFANAGVVWCLWGVEMGAELISRLNESTTTDFRCSEAPGH
jgi:hypothetical protein